MMKHSLRVIALAGLAAAMAASPVLAAPKINAPNVSARSLPRPHVGGSAHLGVSRRVNANIAIARTLQRRTLGGNADGIRELQNADAIREMENLRGLEDMMKDLRDGGIGGGALPDLSGGGDAGGDCWVSLDCIAGNTGTEDTPSLIGGGPGGGGGGRNPFANPLGSPTGGSRVHDRSGWARQDRGGAGQDDELPPMEFSTTPDDQGPGFTVVTTFHTRDGGTRSFSHHHKSKYDWLGTPRATVAIGPVTGGSADEVPASEPDMEFHLGEAECDADMCFTLEEAESYDEDEPEGDPDGQPAPHDGGSGGPGGGYANCYAVPWGFACTKSIFKTSIQDKLSQPGPDQAENGPGGGTATPRLGREAVTNPGDGSFTAGGGTGGGGGGSLPDLCATVNGCGGDEPGPAG